uniref:LAGLIDADG endonuclease n=1 Tax=Inonotus hispidus TaxID=40469 RepID=UPI0021821C97|nr:LAGLIDADG endonuclease [Inonotus hispidus]YP_010691052.1 LAGLIDADG endonuclease [Phellinus igniarius]UVF37965.1 LAGLIDADG endonuclease [Inonotus hispidus]WBU93153.1 LAGLIDADG endonuclease [Phellinus igniarius]
MGFERNYQLKIPSKQLNISKFSTLNNSSKISPWFWTGLIDGEGSFSIIITKSKTHKSGWRIEPKFQIGLHKRDLSLLLQLQQFLGGIGSIYKNLALNKVNYSVYNKTDLKSLINHLEKYSLLTQKAADFILFKEVVKLMNNKAHLTIEGIKSIVNIKASMNLGLSDFLKFEFVDFIPVDRPFINTENIPDPNWISGFVTGEGNFDVRISQDPTYVIGHKIQLRFRISQQEKDKNLMECLIKHLGSGKLYKYPGGKPAVVLIITKFSDIINIIIPFFLENPLLGIKLLDFIDWCKVAKLISTGSHLTLDGLDLIRKIKSGMNRGRDITDI